MTDLSKPIENILADLLERAKELNCLYEIEKLVSSPDATAEDIIPKIIAALPAGVQYPDIAQVRIKLWDSVFTSPRFEESPWVLAADVVVQGDRVGSIELFYTQQMPNADEGPFLKEERKLIITIADRVSSFIVHRVLVDALEDWRAAREELAKSRTGEWRVILDLLRHSDQSLLLRVTRKMLNHLGWSGVSEAQALLARFGAGGQTGDEQVQMESNRPRRKGQFPASANLVEETFRIAAQHLSNREIVTCIQRWIREDRAGFLVTTLETPYASLVEIGDALTRFHHTAPGEVELPLSTLKGLAVSLIRRFLTDQLDYINVAKQYVSIESFHDLLHRLICPARGYGKLGGKSSGLFLAEQVIRRSKEHAELFAAVRTPQSWYITSDGLHDFVHRNNLEDVFTQKYKEINQVRQEYPHIIQVFKHSQFSPEIAKGLSVAMDEFGTVPLIVRSSSLLEDRIGAAFSGKYKSLFLANQGSKQERLNALLDAIAEVYASTFSPDPIEYRAERNLLDFQEGMGIMVQEVVGTRVGKYYLPTFAGVAFSHNEFRWSPRIKREDGLVRIVPGLGTRAVDRLSDDYPILLAPGQPGLRVNVTVDEVIRYAPTQLDVINLDNNAFETISVTDFLRQGGHQLPGLGQLVSVCDRDIIREPVGGHLECDPRDVVVTCNGLVQRTPFIKQIHALLQALEDGLGTPVDIEFASDGKYLYLLQCRAQSHTTQAMPAAIPRDLSREQIIFSANRYVSNGRVPDVTHIVYIDPDAYAEIADLQGLVAVGRAVGKLNAVLPKHQFVLMGPGRWGSRGDVKLGVKVTYSDINNTAVLIEIARKKGNYVPDLSFGTHFFQDLEEVRAEGKIIYPDDEGIIFNHQFLTQSPNVLSSVAPEYAALENCVRVIDVPRVTRGKVLRVLMNADLEEAVGILADPASTSRPATDGRPYAGTEPEDHWRWRMRMAERVAEQLEPSRFGVVALYVFGSTKNATAGPASDIDLLVHFRGTEAQRAALLQWFEGWSLCLSEMNYLRTGARTAGLLDVHLVTDEDIAQRSSYAAKIDAVTDAARLLPVGPQGNRGNAASK